MLFLQTRSETKLTSAEVVPDSVWQACHVPKTVRWRFLATKRYISSSDRETSYSYFYRRALLKLVAFDSAASLTETQYSVKSYNLSRVIYISLFSVNLTRFLSKIWKVCKKTAKINKIAVKLQCDEPQINQHQEKKSVIFLWIFQWQFV